MQEPVENNYKLKALKFSAIAISSVVLVEVSLGLAVGSLAILSDGLHALLDALTTFGLFIATRASIKPPDEEHMYGHEKLESLAGLVGGIMLIGVAVLIMFQSIPKIMKNESYINLELDFVGFVAIGYTFCIDFLRVGTFRKMMESESYTVKAGLYHAVADLSSTVIALLGFGLATFGFFRGDSMASMILSLLLTYLSVKLIWHSGMELSDAVSKDVAEKVRKEILGAEGVYKCEHLRVRRAGTKTFVEATVKVPEFMSLEEAHNLASKIETKIKNSLGNVDATIHIEPSETEARVERIVERIAAEVEDVKEVHEINTVYTNGKLYITLHARVDPRLSVHEAHEIAEKIEGKLNERINNVENVTVHIEPFEAKVRKGSKVDEDEIRKIIHETVKPHLQTFRIRRIVTYVSDKKRYINIDGYFSETTTIEEAHNLASHIEEGIKKRFVESVVTVHMEPEKKEKDVA